VSVPALAALVVPAQAMVNVRVGVPDQEPATESTPPPSTVTGYEALTLSGAWSQKVWGSLVTVAVT
jgi:hypothetical protein